MSCTHQSSRWGCWPEAQIYSSPVMHIGFVTSLLLLTLAGLYSGVGLSALRNESGREEKQIKGCEMQGLDAGSGTWSVGAEISLPRIRRLSKRTKISPTGNAESSFYTQNIFSWILRGFFLPHCLILQREAMLDFIGFAWSYGGW